LRSVALGPDAFDCFQVDRAVGNVRKQGPQLATPNRRAGERGDPIYA
jgi:hypothetical protein